MDELDLSPHLLLENADLLYQFVDLFSNYENTVRDYGGNQYFTMNEIHVLAAIAKKPGILSSQLAEERHCSKSFISQIVTKLERFGYISKRTVEQDKKKKGLYATESGMEIARAHDAFDVKTLKKTYNYLRRDCKPEEIRHFYKVIQTYVNIMTAAESKRRQQSMLER